MIPVTVVTGFLGVGKTTAIRQLLAHAPDGEKWAVLVNEFGEVDIDAAVLSEGALEVRAVAGGCICCASALPFRVALVRLLRDVKPDRVIIEPSGLADPASILDALRAEGVREHVDVMATIGLVHPLRYRDERFSEHPVYQKQLALADVLVANFGDTTKVEDLEAFQAAAVAMDPPKQVVAVTAHGDLDPAWLDLRPSPRAPGPLSWRTDVVVDRAGRGLSTPTQAHGFDSHGFVWPTETVFDADALEEALKDLAVPVDNPLFPDGLTRMKGIFRTPGRWLRVDAVDGGLRFLPVAWRRDSRLSLIAPSGDWNAARDRVSEAIIQRGTPTSFV